MKQPWRHFIKFVQLLLLSLLCGTQLSLLPVFSVEHPLAPPDTSSPQATIQSFIENVNEAHHILMTANAQYLSEPGLFPSASVKEQVAPGRILFERAIACLDTSKVPSRLKQDAGVEGTILLKEILDRIDIPPYDEIPD
ncbi:MAG: hypothetical protein F6K11_38040, partial [Leptolyngbya sp. SIO3F4]|nr:hypothetical protein [Leptolyngbya sp. SIO3F4]